MAGNQFMDFFSEYSLDPQLRLAYTMHLYNTCMVLFSQLFFTFGAVTLVNFYDPAAFFVLANLQTFIYFGGFGALAVVFYSSLIAKSIDSFQVGIFTILETMSICGFAVMQGRDIIALAMIVTFERPS